MEKQKKAYIYALCAIGMWSTVASAFKISLRSMTYDQLLFWAAITSTIVLFIILLIQGKLHLIRQSSLKQHLHSLLLGALNPFIYYAVLFRAYEILPAQEAITLNYTWPIMIVLLSIPILKQKIRLTNILALCISFIGIVIIITQGNLQDFTLMGRTADLLPLCSAVIWAIYWIYNMKYKHDTGVKLFLNFCYGLLFIFIFLLISSKITLPPIEGLLGAVYVGIFEMGLTFVVWLKALETSSTTAQVSNLIYMTPFFSLLIVSLVINEEILPSSIVGLILIVIGIFIQQYNKKCLKTLSNPK
ncbi:MAG: DMT family transporter [Candidatus Cloacimonadia bacterium]